MTADVFWRQFNSRRASVGQVRVTVPPGTSPLDLIAAAEKATGVGLTRRSSSTGVFEIQTDEGIWSASDGRALVTFNPRRGLRLRAEATFTTWRELEQREEAERMLAALMDALLSQPPSGFSATFIRHYFAQERASLLAALLPLVQGEELREPPPRLQDRLVLVGADRLSSEELCQLLLGLGEEEAHALLRRVGGVAKLWRRGVHELQAAGLSEEQAGRVRAALELGRRTLRAEEGPAPVMLSPQDIADYVRADLALREQETLLVLGLDARHRVRSQHVAAVGQVDRVQVGLSDIFRPLIREGMAAVVVVHNHPSGMADPSPADEVLTARVEQVGQMLGIPLLDHLVLTRTGHYSFADAGRLNRTRFADAGRPKR